MDEFGMIAGELRSLFVQFVAVLDAALVTRASAHAAGMPIATVGDAKPSRAADPPTVSEPVRNWLLKIVQRCGAAGISRTKLSPHTQGLTASERNGALAALVASGQIEMRKVQSGTRFADYFFPIVATITRSLPRR